MSAQDAAVGPRSRSLNWALRAFEFPAIIALFAMMLQVSYNAFARFALNAPLAGTLEMTQFWYMPIISLIGFVAAQARRQHVHADLVFSRFPEAAKRISLLLGYGLAALASAGFAWYGLEEANRAYDIQLTAGFTASIPVWPVTYLVPLAFSILTIQFFYACVQALRGAETGANATQETLG